MIDFSVCIAYFIGMINILHGLGLRLLALGHHTPFMVWYGMFILKYMYGLNTSFTGFSGVSRQ